MRQSHILSCVMRNQLLSLWNKYLLYILYSFLSPYCKLRTDFFRVGHKSPAGKHEDPLLTVQAEKRGY